VHTSNKMTILSTSYWILVLGWFKSLLLESKFILLSPVLKRLLLMLRLIITSFGLSDGVL
jgi:hypothetical protein